MSIKKRYVIFGAGRGFGKAVAAHLATNAPANFLFVSRKLKNLQQLCTTSFFSNGESFSFDCTELDKFSSLKKRLQQFSPSHLYYISGGGPHGLYKDKDFKDHLWAYHLNLIFPAKLLHWALDQKNIKQIIFTGSCVAESQPDALAASYSSAKHGLKGLITSINQEGVDCDLRLFSPGYMDTQMLPPNSLPFRQGRATSALEVANKFVEWANDASGLKHYEWSANTSES